MIPAVVGLVGAVLGIVLVCVPTKHAIHAPKRPAIGPTPVRLTLHEPEARRARAAMDRYVDVAAAGSGVSAASLQRVGHQAGSFREFPVKPAELTRTYNGQLRRAPVLQVPDLMRQAFDQFGLDGIEIDAKLVPDGTDTMVCVVHDGASQEDLQDPTIRAYLRDNQLESAVESLLRHHAGRTLYIELKTEKKTGVLAPADSTLIRRTHQELEAVLRRPAMAPLAAGAREHIAFVSFHFGSLELMDRHAGPRPTEAYRLYAIIGTDRPGCSRLVGCLGEATITDTRLRRIREATWLTGVWLDPSVVVHLEAVLDSMNRDRTEELRLGLSTYYSTFGQFSRKVAAESTGGDRRVESLIFELDVFPPRRLPIGPHHRRRTQLWWGDELLESP